MNKLMVIGNLTRDPDLRSVNTQQGQVSVCSFTVAVNRRTGGQNEQTDYFNVTAWRVLGENCAKYLNKGKKVYVSGPVSARTYQAQDGTTRVSMDIVADEVEFLSAKDASQQTQTATAQQAAPAPVQRDKQTGMQTMMNDDDLPF